MSIMDVILYVYVFIIVVLVTLYVVNLFPNKAEPQLDQKKVTTLKQEFKSIDKPLACQDEKSVTITKLYVHPIRGIRAAPVKHAYICPYGMMYDREIVVIDVAKNAVATSSDHLELANLTQ